MKLKNFFLLFAFFFVFDLVRSQNFSIDTIFVSISKSDFHALERQRLNVLEQKIKKIKLEFVPCIVKYKNHAIPAKIRLKGDRLIHFEEGNTSYRIELNGDNFIMEMQKFSFHRPRAKNYVYENLFHLALEREGILNLKYIYVYLYINDKNLGIYAMEQFTEKALVERSGRIYGPILHFSEDIQNTNLDSMPVEIFGKEPKTVDGVSVYATEKKLLEDFKNGKLKPSALFDTRKMAIFFALTDVLGFHHATVPKSMRLYCNPIIAKLEPIGFDGHHGTERKIYITAEMGINPQVGWYYDFYRRWYDFFFSNPETFDIDFFERYMNALKRMTKKEYIDELFKDTDDEIKKQWELLKTYSSPLLADSIFWFGPGLFNYSTDEIYKRQDYIRNLLANKNRIKAVILKNNNGHLTIGVKNTERLPLELLTFKYMRKKYNISSAILLPSDNWTKDSSYSILETYIPGFSNKKEDLIIEYRLLGMDEVNAAKIEEMNSTFSFKMVSNRIVTKVDKLSKLLEYIKDFPFMSYDFRNNTIKIKEGKWAVNKPVIIPSGYKVIARKGVEINLTNQAYMIFYSPIDFKGEANNMIKIYSSDSTGMGMFVASEGKQNIMIHTEFSNMNSLNISTFRHTGAVTFYESPVNVYYCSFLLARSEDALNIVRSDFELAWSLFDGPLSDAFDGDFVNGKIQDCTFKNTGNDAIDGSGSIIKIERVIMKNIGDKGISAGEISTIIAQNCYVDSAKAGYISKDLSHLTLKNCYVSKATYGLAVYQKKGLFGPSFMTADQVEISGVKVEYVVEDKSIIIHNNRKIEPNVRDAVLLLYDTL